MQNLQIINVNHSERNNANVNVQFKGSILRTDLPTGFVSSTNSGNVLLAAALGLNANEVLSFTVWQVFSKEVFAKHCKDNKMFDKDCWPTNIDALFGDAVKDDETVVGVIARTTFDLDGDVRRNVANPKTGEIMQYQGRDVKVYTTLTKSAKGSKNIALFLGHEQPSWIKVPNVVDNNTAEGAL